MDMQTLHEILAVYCGMDLVDVTAIEMILYPNMTMEDMEVPKQCIEPVKNKIKEIKSIL